MNNNSRIKIGKPFRLNFLVYIAALAIIVCLGLSIQSFTNSEKNKEVDVENCIYSVKSVKTPQKLEFAGERVPLDNFDIRESLDKELLINTYWHSQTILFIKKANRYFPLIKQVLRANNIPDDFKYLAVAESGLSNVVSPKKAVGFWQLLEGTAKDYGLEVTNEVDERYHLAKSTEAACKFFKESYEVYDSWTLTAASFNAGRRGIDRQIVRQKQNDYYDLLLFEETARYIYRILALKLVMSNPEEYGFYLDKNDFYSTIPYYEVKVDSTITNIAEFALSHSTNYKIVKILNPWLRENSVSNKYNKTYIIKIPQMGIRSYSKVLKSDIND